MSYPLQLFICKLTSKLLTIFSSIVEKIYEDIIKVLPTNCWWAVKQWNQMFTEIQNTSESLLEEYEDCCTLYENLLPYIYEKCDYDISKLFDAAMNVIKDSKKKKILIDLRIGKDHTTSVNPNV